MAQQPNANSSAPRSLGPISLLVNLLSSVWSGITLLVLIFIYSSGASAYPPIRQHWMLELTEFEAFTWWPFNLLMFLLMANLIVVTLRKIPFNAVNLGVWLIHTGIVILILSSTYYFSTKVEGDTPIFRRQVVIQVPGHDHEARMLCRPGNKVTVGSGDDTHTFSIMSIQPEYSLRTEGHEGEQAYAVQVMVERPGQEPFIRQLLANYPEFTEDVIPGKGRAIKATGKALVDETLQLSLDYEPQQHFFLQHTAALYVKSVGGPEWTQKPIDGLPHYHERFSSRQEVWIPEAGDFPVRPIDLTVASQGADDPLEGYDVHVTGFLRYASIEANWVPGGNRLNPVCRLVLGTDQGGGSQSFELAAFDRNRSHDAGGQVSFRWAQSAEELASLESVQQATLSIRIPDTDIAFNVPAVASEAEDFVPIEGSSYAYRVRNVINNLDVPSGPLQGRAISIAIVEIRNGDREFTRWVADLAKATRDVAGPGHMAADLDQGIQMTYQPGESAILTVVAGPDPVGTQLLYRASEDQTLRFEAELGQEVELRPGVTAKIAYLYPNARSEVRPAITAMHKRERAAGEQFSMIQIEMSKGSWSKSMWMPFHQYAMPNSQYRYPGRIGYDPDILRLPDGKSVEILFSRRRQELPSPVTLEDFELLTFQGGLIGTNSNVRDYISQLRFADGQGGWAEPEQMSSNMPATNQGFWFFQSTWDPPQRGIAGMNYTGAGVGNRNGVYIQLFGCCVSVAGMIYAFYVKPTVKRRRLEAAALRGDRRRAMDNELVASNALEEAPVGG